MPNKQFKRPKPAYTARIPKGINDSRSLSQHLYSITLARCEPANNGKSRIALPIYGFPPGLIAETDAIRNNRPRLAADGVPGGKVCARTFRRLGHAS